MCTDNTINKCKFSYVVYSKLLYNLGHYFLDIQYVYGLKLQQVAVLLWNLAWYLS